KVAGSSPAGAAHASHEFGAFRTDRRRDVYCAATRWSTIRRMRSFYAWGVIGLLSTIACSNGAKQSDPTAFAVVVDITSPTEAEPFFTEALSPTEVPAPFAVARKLEKLVLRHQGPPVSSEYARSYVITITPGKIHRETMGPKRAVA